MKWLLVTSCQGQVCTSVQQTFCPSRCLALRAMRFAIQLMMYEWLPTEYLWPMADVHSSETRSYNMRRIKSRDTKPEILMRKFLHAQGYRFRLHVKDLPVS